MRDFHKNFQFRPSKDILAKRLLATLTGKVVSPYYYLKIYNTIDIKQMTCKSDGIFSY